VSVAADAFDEFRKHYGFDDWREPQAGGEALFIWRFALGGQELPDHRALRIDTVELPDLPPAIQSLWRADNEEADRVMLRLDVTEASSVPVARALLFRALTEFQSPQIERITDGPGDIAFGPGGHRSLVFARANIVVVVRSAGDDVQSVERPAHELDRLLHEGPEGGESTVRPTIRRAEVEPTSVSGPRQVRLVLDVDDPLGRHIWFRFSAHRGEFLAQRDGVVFRPEDEGEQAIEIGAVNENLGLAVERVEFTL
jgi:hypothetical protein